MGKKDGKKRRREDEDDMEGSNNLLAADPELEAELAAVAAIRAEKEGNKQPDNANEKATYNREGLTKCLQDLDTADMPFVQTLEINEFEFPETNELDDMEREMNFYNHAVMAVKSGYGLLEELGVPVHRPHDFFCEHVKSDAHMARIKDRLILEEKKIEAFEKRKNREQSRKFNKQLALLKKTQKSKDEKHLLKEIDTIKKSKDGDKDQKLERILNSDGRSGSRGSSREDRDRPEKSKKRKIMDQKYGFGGRDRKRAKLNDSKSLNDMRDFNPRGGKSIQNVLPKGRGPKGKPNRPGKASRAKARANRKK